MSDTIKVHSTSLRTAQVDEDVWLEKPADPDSVLTRRVVRSELVNNEHSDVARVAVLPGGN